MQLLSYFFAKKCPSAQPADRLQTVIRPFPLFVLSVISQKVTEPQQHIQHPEHIRHKHLL